MSWANPSLIFKYFQGSKMVQGTMARDKGKLGFKGFNSLGMFGLDCRHLPCYQEHNIGFGQEMATEKSKILAKCLNSSNPSLALQMLSDCGMNVTREPLGIGPSPSVDWTVALATRATS